MTPVSPLEDTPVPGGRVEIAENAIVSVIHETVLNCYGVVDLGFSAGRSPFRRALKKYHPTYGINIDVNDNRLEVELSIVAEFGTPIFTVAQNVMQSVKFQVERLLGMTVDRVNVNVDGLRVSKNSEKTK